MFYLFQGKPFFALTPISHFVVFLGETTSVPEIDHFDVICRRNLSEPHAKYILSFFPIFNMVPVWYSGMRLSSFRFKWVSTRDGRPGLNRQNSSDSDSVSPNLNLNLSFVKKDLSKKPEKTSFCYFGTTNVIICNIYNLIKLL